MLAQRMMNHPKAVYPRFDDKALLYSASKIVLSGRNKYVNVGDH